MTEIYRLQEFKKVSAAIRLTKKVIDIFKKPRYLFVNRVIDSIDSGIDKIIDYFPAPIFHHAFCIHRKKKQLIKL